MEKPKTKASTPNTTATQTTGARSTCPTVWYFLGMLNTMYNKRMPAMTAKKHDNTKRVTKFIPGTPLSTMFLVKSSIPQAQRKSR